jgi:hypothetical protein
VALEGNADPAQVAAQRATMARSVAAAHEQGRADAQRPLGEDEIAPEATDETLAAKVPGGGGGASGGAGAGGGGSPNEETASILAHEKSQGELDAAVDQGQEDMAQEEESEREASEAEKQRTEHEAEKAEAEAEEEQEAETTAAKREVAKKRGEWSEAQQAAVDKSSADADAEQKEADDKVETEKTQADQGAEREIAAGEEKARKEKRDGEAKAEGEKAKAQQESSGFFGWVQSKATAFFNALKEGLKGILKALREAVKAAIDAARKAAVALIEKARQAIVAAIRAAGDALIAISDVALAAFPEAKAKFQQSIREKVQAAEDAVNNIADKLKKGITALLDALGEFLDKALGLLEKALLAVVDAVAAAVQSAIKAAEAAAKALGMFMVLIKDVAANPGQWIANLGAAVVDGIKNHLLKAMKAAISEWFKSKVEEVLGIPIDMMKALFKGGFNLDMIGKMAWEALKTAVPTILIQLLVEKLVAMVVPAAGDVMVVIEGLQAAWGAVSRIIAAIDKFITFLKAVKGGGAGPAFANAVAAAGVVVIDFVANWLLLRLMKPAKKVSGKLAAIAKKILAKIKKALKKIGKALKKLGKKIGGKLQGLFKSKKKRKSKDKKNDNNNKDKKRLQKAKNAVVRRLRKPMPVSRARGIVKSIAAKYKVRGDISGSGPFIIVLKINPEEKAPLKSEDGKDAKALLEGGAAASAAAKADMAAVGRKANQAGQERNKKLRESLDAREKAGEGKAIPTSLQEEGEGLDAAFLTPGANGESPIVELIEGKEGGIRPTRQARGDRPVPVGSTPIPVSGASEAHTKLATDKSTRQEVIGTGRGAGGVFTKKKGTAEERILRNELSSLTSHLLNSVDKMYDAVKAAIKKGTLSPDDESALRSVLTGEGGVLKLVIDVDKLPRRMTDDNREAIVQLLVQAIQTLLFEIEEPKTKIQVVLRKRFDPKSDTIIHST